MHRKGFSGLGLGGAWLLNAAVPALPTHTSWSYGVLAELLAAAIGLGAGNEPSTAMAIFFCMRHPFTYINN